MNLACPIKTLIRTCRVNIGERLKTLLKSNARRFKVDFSVVPHKNIDKTFS